MKVIKLVIILLSVKSSFIWGVDKNCIDIFGELFKPRTSIIKKELPPRIKSEVPFHEETGLFGVSKEMIENLINIIRKHLGSDLLEIYAIGSRVSGKKNILKNNSPVSPSSDLDIVIHLREKHSTNFPIRFNLLSNEIRKLNSLPFPIHILTSSTSNDIRFSQAVIAYPAGEYSTFILIPKDKPIEEREEYSAILLKSFRE